MRNKEGIKGLSFSRFKNLGWSPFYGQLVRKEATLVGALGVRLKRTGILKILRRLDTPSANLSLRRML